MTEESGLLPSLAITVTVATGVVPGEMGDEGANVALVEVEICATATETAVIQITDDRKQKMNTRTTEAGLRLDMPDLRKWKDVYRVFTPAGTKVELGSEL